MCCVVWSLSQVPASVLAPYWAPHLLHEASDVTIVCGTGGINDVAETDGSNVSVESLKVATSVLGMAPGIRGAGPGEQRVNRPWAAACQRWVGD